MKRQTKKLNSKKIIQVVTMLILCLILVFACIFGYSVYKDTATFDSKKLLSSGASVMYDSNGDIMYTYGSQENGTRKNVTYDDLPQVLVDAIVAAEDSRFFFNDSNHTTFTTVSFFIGQDSIEFPTREGYLINTDTSTDILFE